jgi:hypothetical protein
MVGLLPNELQHLFRVWSHRRAARRRGLFSQLDDSPSGGRRIEAAALHAVESCRERLECLSVQIALLRSHPGCDPCERRGRFRWGPGSHIACRRHHDLDSKAFQLRPVDGRENLHRRLRCTGRPVERKGKARGPAADLYDATASCPQGRQECVHDGQGAEYIDFELMPDGVERQNFQWPRGEYACIVDQETKAATAKRLGHAGGPSFHSLLLGDVADRQADAAAGGLFQVLDLRGRDRGTENNITLGRWAHYAQGALATMSKRRGAWMLPAEFHADYSFYKKFSVTDTNGESGTSLKLLLKDIKFVPTYRLVWSS